MEEVLRFSLTFYSLATARVIVSLGRFSLVLASKLVCSIFVLLNKAETRFCLLGSC